LASKLTAYFPKTKVDFMKNLKYLCPFNRKYALLFAQHQFQFSGAVEFVQSSKMLKNMFSEIVFTEALPTKPYGDHYKRPFVNVLAIANHSASADEIDAQLKEIEKRLGRAPADKQKGKVVIDLDLIAADGKILRPKTSNGVMCRICFHKSIAWPCFEKSIETVQLMRLTDFTPFTALSLRMSCSRIAVFAKRNRDNSPETVHRWNRSDRPAFSRLPLSK